MNDNIMKRNIRERDDTTAMISSSLPDDRQQLSQGGTTQQSKTNANHNEKPYF